MNLNQNSIHARLYREFYNTEELPTNLCPFFWGLLLAWLCTPFYFIILFPIKRQWFIGKVWTWVVIALGVIIGVVIVFTFLYAQYHLIKYWLNCYSYDSELATLAGILDSLLIGSIILTITTNKVSKRKFIVTEFVKAKYGKYCPHIQWNKNS